MFNRSFALSIVILLISCKDRERNEAAIKEEIEVNYLYSADSILTIKYDDRSFLWEVNNKTISLPYNGDVNHVTILASSDTLRFRLKPSQSIPISIIGNQKDTIRITAKGRPKPANYDSSYIANNNGTYSVQIPEVHELINIAFALTEIGQDDKNLVNQRTAYYNDIQTRFGQFADHPLIKLMNLDMQNDAYRYYYNLKMNSCMYSFNADGSIVNISPYDRLGWGENLLVEKLDLVEDFAVTTGFGAFYTEHRSYYDSLLDTYHRVVPVTKMWVWLQERFPDRYNSYKIYFSPLVGGAHATQNFSDSGYRETVMFVNAPIFNDTSTSMENEIDASRTIFTEIDHNYVNPISDEFSNVINQSFSERFYWVLDDPGLDGYPSPYSVFNEYMTWSLYSLYCMDSFPKSVYSSYLDVLENDMIRKRGFIKFDAFNRRLIKLYEMNKDQNSTELMISMLAWSSSQQLAESGK